MLQLLPTERFNMSIAEKIEKVKIEWSKGTIKHEDLLLHIEPLLMQAAECSEDEKTVMKIVNSIEKIIFTQVEPCRSSKILELIDEGVKQLKI